MSLKLASRSIFNREYRVAFVTACLLFVFNIIWYFLALNSNGHVIENPVTRTLGGLTILITIILSRRIQSRQLAAGTLMLGAMFGMVIGGVWSGEANGWPVRSVMTVNLMIMVGLFFISHSMVAWLYLLMATSVATLISYRVFGSPDGPMLAFFCLAAIGVNFYGTRNRIKTLNELRLSEERLAATLDTLSEGLIMFNSDGKVSSVNKSAAQIIGINESTFEKNGFNSLAEAGITLLNVDMTECEYLQLPFVRILTENKPIENFEFLIQKSDGTQRHILSNTVLIHRMDFEINNQVIFTLTDVTNLKKKESELRNQEKLIAHENRMSALGVMSGGVAHEINNPLQIIKSMTNFLSIVDPSPKKLEERVAVIDKAVTRISRIVNGLRKFSSPSASDKRSRKNIKNIITDIEPMIKLYADEFKVPLEILIEPTPDFMCDEIEIGQVIVNLVNNATDAVHGSKGAWIKINVFNSSSKIILQVLDSGTGIPENCSAKIFDPFFTTKDIGKGTGLGLCISKGIIESHGGSLILRKDMTNTCFEIQIPAPA